MGILDTIKKAIFGKAVEAELAVGRPINWGAGVQPSSPVRANAATVDVSAYLDAAVATKGQKLNWRSSIVDLMKTLDLDSSLKARKELARELGYTGDSNDSAAMNVWLRKALILKLADRQ